MTVEIVEIDARELAVVLGVVEDHFTDAKAIEISPARLTRTLSAFSNADGGDLYVGLDEDQPRGGFAWRGFADPEAANGHIQAFEQTFPLGQWADYTFLTSAKARGLVLKISVRKTPHISRATDGTPYLRRGAQNLPVSEPDALQRLEFAKGIRSFETQTVDAPLDMVTNSNAIIGFMLEVVPNTEPEPWLRKQLLIRDDKPTVAALLLFADEPQAALPKQSGVKVYRYATTEAVGTRASLQGQPVTVEGNLYAQIQGAVTTTVDLVEGIRVLAAKGMEEIEYPQVTLHEIITNAVLHRDYSIADDVHVRVFDNRIEVDSPGRLPAHITPSNILEERFSRNGSLVRWINKFPDPPNKDVGEGLRTAFAAMRQLKLKDPEIAESPSSVIVQIRHQRLASPEEMILEYLQTHDEISNTVVRSLTGIGSENRVKGIFQRMIRAGELESVPGRSLRYAAYRLPTRPKR